MITTKDSIESILQNLNIDASLKKIAEKVLNNERISFDDGVLLYEKGELGFGGTLANYIRNKKHGDNTYFNRNFHVEPTNICVYTCKFCSYSKLIKHREQGWEYSIDDILNIIKKWKGKSKNTDQYDKALVMSEPQRRRIRVMLIDRLAFDQKHKYVRNNKYNCRNIKAHPHSVMVTDPSASDWPQHHAHAKGRSAERESCRHRPCPARSSHITAQW